jgi:hypothetical protein
VITSVCRARSSLILEKGRSLGAGETGVQGHYDSLLHANQHRMQPLMQSRLRCSPGGGKHLSRGETNSSSKLVYPWNSVSNVFIYSQLLDVCKEFVDRFGVRLSLNSQSAEHRSTHQTNVQQFYQTQTKLSTPKFNRQAGKPTYCPPGVSRLFLKTISWIQLHLGTGGTSAPIRT